MQKYDAVLFDLDGTLWDAVHTVVKIWNKVLVSVGLEPTMNYDELSKCMGLRIEQIFDRVIPFATEEQRESGLDIADFLLMEETSQMILQRMIRNNPSVQLLIDKFNLEIVE